MNNYIGHPSQLCGIEEHRLVGGKGDGMRLYEAWTSGGLRFTVSADRCGDLSRVSYKGINLGFFGPCGYVAPQHYDPRGAGFLKSFTGGFLTTCGLTAVGSPCVDEGEELPLHGNISHVPAENVVVDTDETLRIKLTMRDASLFGRKFLLTREYECAPDGSALILHDKVQNIAASETPYMILYHFNFGYPLLAPGAELTIPSKSVTPRNDRAAEDLDTASSIIEPQPAFEEQCYFHDLSEGRVKLKNPALGIAVTMEFDTTELPFFTQWKLMQQGEYVMGLEPGNCHPDGRDVMRRQGKLRFLKPGEAAEQTIKITITEE
ncbi:MAG: aldose 1-epimerase family protein [Clostridia bacterium]|nr:aldose 1-epimerase family protein [Clostridia bacterium]